MTTTPDDTIFEHHVCCCQDVDTAVTKLDQLSLAGWSHYSTLTGMTLEDGRTTPLGMTLYVRRPLGKYAAERAASDAHRNGKRKKKKPKKKAASNGG